ncbi:hypothetical protein HPB51_005156 [Rhipicephalus microplus]|uniref:Uncharacterized protein n=1 Tax=Rhipicephalus microplus TaxID=6941 RepID=A0A9J6DL47_RHIMP|nr:hypothetical protein HPB51_005156 [Rhipicephalus microplus]
MKISVSSYRFLKDADDARRRTVLIRNLRIRKKVTDIAEVRSNQSAHDDLTILGSSSDGYAFVAITSTQAGSSPKAVITVNNVSVTSITDTGATVSIVETPPQPPAKLHPRLRTSIHPPLVLDKPDWPTWQPGITSSVFEAASEGYKGQPADSPFGHDIAPYDGMPNLRWLLLQVSYLKESNPGPMTKTEAESFAQALDAIRKLEECQASLMAKLKTAKEKKVEADNKIELLSHKVASLERATASRHPSEVGTDSDANAKRKVQVSVCVAGAQRISSLDEAGDKQPLSSEMRCMSEVGRPCDNGRVGIEEPSEKCQAPIQSCGRRGLLFCQRVFCNWQTSQKRLLCSKTWKHPLKLWSLMKTAGDMTP